MTVEAMIALNRFGLGAKPGEAATVAEDPARWLRDQLHTGTGDAGFFATLPGSADTLIEFQQNRRREREARQNGKDGATDPVEQLGRMLRTRYLQQAEARYSYAATTGKPFVERLVHFWSNHFAVSADKPPIPALAGTLENEAIRPNVSGSFLDLLVAVEQHPAMLLYLDNQRSVGPNSTLGSRANRRRGRQQFGLNENLAREILELHTLGVDGGYTEADVAGFAKVLTGWSLGGDIGNGRFAEGEPGTFEFRDNIHEPGTKTVLGRVYREDGLAEGEAVLRTLAMHPATARHIATKLARHFVADEPPAGLVDRLAAAYLDNDAELLPVYEALLDSPEAWAAEPLKYKTPHEFLVSTLRAFDHEPDNPRFIIGALDLMGQAPWRPGSPAGWPDTAAEWGGADALYKRIEWSNTVAGVIGNRVDPVELGDAVLGPALTSDTRGWLQRAESREQGIALLLASPDFQRR